MSITSWARDSNRLLLGGIVLVVITLGASWLFANRGGHLWGRSDIDLHSQLEPITPDTYANADQALLASEKAQAIAESGTLDSASPEQAAAKASASAAAAAAADAVSNNPNDADAERLKLD